MPDIFAKLERLTFEKRIQSDLGVKRGTSKVELFRTRKSLDFTAKIHHKATDGFRFNASICDNGRSVVIIGREISDLNNPTIDYLDCLELRNALPELCKFRCSKSELFQGVASSKIVSHDSDMQWEFYASFPGSTDVFYVNAVAISATEVEVRLVGIRLETGKTKKSHIVRNWKCAAANAAHKSVIPQKMGYLAISGSNMAKDFDHRDDGLIVVFGSTGCGKSYVADDIAKYYFQKANSKGHILRFGDPVEGMVSSFNLNKAIGNLDQDALETQRHKPEDVNTIRTFMSDALRQKPSIVTLSELRSSRDFIDAIELASTGHLVIATAHAGSLEEGFLRMMKAYGSLRDSKLNLPLAKALKAVIYLRHQDIDLIPPYGDFVKARIVRPTVWLRSELTEQQLVATGVDRLRPSSARGSFCRSSKYYLNCNPEGIQFAGKDIDDKDAVMNSLRDQF